MPALMIEHGKRVATSRAGFQRHVPPIADIELIARCINGLLSLESSPAPQLRRAEEVMFARSAERSSFKSKWERKNRTFRAVRES